MEILVQPFGYEIAPCDCDEGGSGGGGSYLPCFWYDSNYPPSCPLDLW